MAEAKKIEIYVLGVRAKFEEWIKGRGGVRVWNNVDMSNLDGGDMYTPALTEDGKEYPKSRWSHAQGELIQDIGRFVFATEEVLVKRFHVGIRLGAQGMCLKLTDASSARVHRECQKVKDKYGRAPSYGFDYEAQDCLINLPIFEGEAFKDGEIVRLPNHGEDVISHEEPGLMVSDFTKGTVQIGEVRLDDKVH